MNYLKENLKEIIKMSNPVIECVKCLSLEVNEMWYKRNKAPSHKPIYKSGVCNECKDKFKLKKGASNANDKT